jgi:hypothetical protein
VATNFYSATGANGVIYALGLQGNNIIIGGNFSKVQGQTRQRIARLVLDGVNDGALDDTFKPGLGPDGAVYDIEIQSDQRILIGGAFRNVNGFPRAGVARLNSSAPPADIVVSSASINGTDIQFTVATEIGISYNVEVTKDFSSWTVAKSIIASGNSELVTLPMDEDHQFFRVTRASP